MPPSEAATSPQRVRVSLLLDEVFEERKFSLSSMFEALKLLVETLLSVSLLVILQRLSPMQLTSPLHILHGLFRISITK
jgi:hypothetical protein